MLTDEVWEAVQWWRDWTTFGVLPWGSESVLLEPHFVYQVLERCAAVAARAQGRQEAEARRRMDELHAQLLSRR